MSMDQWQLCPKCKGDNSTCNWTGIKCPVCNGAMIINSFTGRPPANINRSISTATTGFAIVGDQPFTIVNENLRLMADQIIIEIKK